MSLTKQLYDLQQTDLDLEVKGEMLQQVHSQLGETQALQEARDSFKQAQERLSSLEKEQRAGEWEIEDFQTKISAREKKLYKDRGRPKELEGLRKEVELLRMQKRKKEDEVLEIMSQVEKQYQEVELRRGELERIEKGWQEMQKQLLAEKANIERQLAEGEQRRKSLVANVDPGNLELYEALRRKKLGRAVAKVEQGRCQGCRLSLPVSDLQRVRTGEPLTYCSSCGRILYLVT